MLLCSEIVYRWVKCLRGRKGGVETIFMFCLENYLREKLFVSQTNFVSSKPPIDDLTLKTRCFVNGIWLFTVTAALCGSKTLHNWFRICYLGSRRHKEANGWKLILFFIASSPEKNSFAYSHVQHTGGNCAFCSSRSRV